MKRFLFVSLALVGVVAAAPFAHATVLVPGGSSTSISTSTLAGLTLVDQFAAAPSALAAPSGGVAQTIFGTYQEWVYRDASGNLTFLEQVNLTSASDPVHRITAADYTGFTTDVSYLTGSLPPTGTAGGGVPNNVSGGPVIDRTEASTVGFNFTTTAIPPGGNSVVLAITTNAKAYNRLGTLSVINATTSSNLTFQPIAVPAVPEPGTIALALTGLPLLVGGAWLRRRRAHA
jgi:hypothetical protein